LKDLKDQMKSSPLSKDDINIMLAKRSGQSARGCSALGRFANT
jgi:hypothetical protein